MSISGITIPSLCFKATNASSRSSNRMWIFVHQSSISHCTPYLYTFRRRYVDARVYFILENFDILLIK